MKPILVLSFIFVIMVSISKRHIFYTKYETRMSADEYQNRLNPESCWSFSCIMRPEPRCHFKVYCCFRESISHHSHHFIKAFTQYIFYRDNFSARTKLQSVDPRQWLVSAWAQCMRSLVSVNLHVEEKSWPHVQVVSGCDLLKWRTLDLLQVIFWTMFSMGFVHGVLVPFATVSAWLGILKLDQRRLK